MIPVLRKVPQLNIKYIKNGGIIIDIAAPGDGAGYNCPPKFQRFGQNSNFLVSDKKIFEQNQNFLVQRYEKFGRSQEFYGSDDDQLQQIVTKFR